MLHALRRGLKTTCAVSLALRCDEEQPLFKFGVIADIQYCDTDDASNFAGTELRRYRGCLEGARAAREAFEREGVAFVAQLGDLIDGQNGGAYGVGRTAGRQSEAALETVLDALGDNLVYVHCVGNHELYNFPLEDLAESLNRGRHLFEPSFAFDVGAWRFVVLNPYEISLMSKGTAYDEAERLLLIENPDVVGAAPGTVDFFNGLRGDKLRFVPFNGACGERQRQWLKTSIAGAKGNVVILSHIPLHPNSANWRNVPYDAPELLQLLDEFRDRVAAVFAGHSHRGGYAHEAGIHHVTVPATLTHATSFGIVDVYSDRLHLRGFGSLPSMPLEEEEEEADNNKNMQLLN